MNRDAHRTGSVDSVPDSVFGTCTCGDSEEVHNLEENVPPEERAEYPIGCTVEGCDCKKYEEDDPRDHCSEP